MKYIFGVLGIIVIIVVAIMLLRGGGKNPDDLSGNQQVNLSEYVDSGAEAVHTTYSELVGEEERRAIRITVSRNQRMVEILSGYNERVIRKKTFSNTQAAYDEFLHALKNAGFSREQEADYKEEKGVCPNGNRTVYQLRENDEDIFRLWSTSCDRDDGNFGGKPITIEDLFEDQILNYSDIVEDVDI
jgi:hypothetical protein